MASVVYSHQFSWPAKWAQGSNEDREPQEIARPQEIVADSDASSESDQSSPSAFEGMIGTSEALKRVLADVQTVASTDSTVLLQGETGTGKELVSQAIHTLSRRQSRNFVKLNCAAIPTGLLE